MGLPALTATPMQRGRIHKVGFGWINVDGKMYEQDRIVHPAGVSSPWWRRRRHVIDADGVLGLIGKYDPDQIILGTGWMGMIRVDTEAVRDICQQHNVRWTACRTPEAATEYNRSMIEGRRLIAALHLAC